MLRSLYHKEDKNDTLYRFYREKIIQYSCKKRRNKSGSPGLTDQQAKKNDCMITPNRVSISAPLNSKRFSGVWVSGVRLGSPPRFRLADMARSSFQPIACALRACLLEKPCGNFFENKEFGRCCGRLVLCLQLF
jgi:hypothetical protein